MIEPLRMILEGTALLRCEIAELVRNGASLDDRDRVFGYVYDIAEDVMVEACVVSLAVVRDTLYALMRGRDGIEAQWNVPGLECPDVERDGFLPGWFELDDGFDGLLLPTLMNIAESLVSRNK